ncbi:hypothetical protein EVAR_17316_1 [Eumeta japonica]|uniref:Uncharacterized protein n=1 Tax=Eumeta variegata TaxID=151549 RepID=A0A4C1TT71_EUMVA|nr:hypothetical protein EVAR_17316_1 [Eumeta japonica]
MINKSLRKLYVKLEVSLREVLEWPAEPTVSQIFLKVNGFNILRHVPLADPGQHWVNVQASSYGIRRSGLRLVSRADDSMVSRYKRRRNSLYVHGGEATDEKFTNEHSKKQRSHNFKAPNQADWTIHIATPISLKRL